MPRSPTPTNHAPPSEYLDSGGNGLAGGARACPNLPQIRFWRAGMTPATRADHVQFLFFIGHVIDAEVTVVLHIISAAEGSHFLLPGTILAEVWGYTRYIIPGTALLVVLLC